MALPRLSVQIFGKAMESVKPQRLVQTHLSPFSCKRRKFRRLKRSEVGPARTPHYTPRFSKTRSVRLFMQAGEAKR